MPFSLRSIPYKANATAKTELEQELYSEIQNLPAAEANKEDIEEHNGPLDPKTARGVLEKGYIIIGSESENTGKATIGATQGIETCIAVSFYYDGFLVLTHIDEKIEANDLKKILDLFTKKVEIRFFGGVSEKENELRHISAKTKAIEIYLYLYEYASEHAVEIDILSANTFDKTDDYKEQHKENLTIACALNSKNGKVLVFHDEKSGKKVPYHCRIETFPPFSDLFLRNKVYLWVFQLCGYSSYELLKCYDSRDKDWDSKFLQNWDKKASIGIPAAIVKELGIFNERHAAYLVEHIKKDLENWHQQFGNSDKLYIFDIIEYAGYKLYHVKNQVYYHESKKPFKDNQINNLFIIRLLNSKLIEKEYQRYLLQEILQEVISYFQGNTAITKNAFNLLETTLLYRTLMEELSAYLRFNKDLKSESCKDNLIVMLIVALQDSFFKAVEEDIMKSTIEQWQEQKIKVLVLNMVENIEERIDINYNKQLSEHDKVRLMNALEKSLQKSAQEHILAAVEIAYFINKDPLQTGRQLLNEIATLVQSRAWSASIVSLLFQSCYGVVNETMEESIDKAIKGWVKIHLPNFAASSDLVFASGKSEVVTEIIFSNNNNNNSETQPFLKPH